MIARKSMLIIVSHATEALMAYVALFFISRYMGPSEYGIIGFAMGFVGLFTILANLGFNNAHIKNISEGKDRGICIGTFFTTKLGLIGLMSLVTISAVVIWKVVLQRGFESSTHEQAIFIILIYYVFEQLSSMLQSTFSAEIKIAKSEISKFIATIGRTIVIIYVALAGYGAIELAYAYVFGHLLMFITCVVLFRGYKIKKPSIVCFKEYTRFAWPLLIVSSASLLMTNLNNVLIQLFWSSSEVGYYLASYRITGIIVLAGSSVGMIMFPTISGYHATHDVETIKDLLNKAERYICLLALPMVFGLVALAQPFIHIFLSDSFAPALSIMMILPFYGLFYAWVIPFESYYLGINKPEMARNRILMMAAINICLNILLIPKSLFGIKLFGLGAAGSGLATVLSVLIALIFYKIAIYRELKTLGNIRIILHLITAIIMGILLYSLNRILPITRWYEVLVYSLIGLGIYFGILYLIKEFTRNDFKFIIDTLNIKKMFIYIKDEIKK